MIRACALAIAVGMIFSHASVQSVRAENQPSVMPKIGVAFDQELFELALTVFLANSSLNEALAVTEMALLKNPSNLVWRRKGAQTAEWAGKPDIALQHWFYLAQKGDKGAAQSALRVSRSLNELPLRKRLLEKMVVELADPDVHREYLAVVEGMGLPGEAYDMLSSGMIPGGDQLWQLTEQARLAEVLGRPQDAFNAWEKRAVLKSLDTAESMRLALLRYGLGEAGEALDVLRQISRTTSPEEVLFWRTYADLAWALQSIDEAVEAGRVLISSGAAVEIDYQRVQMALQDSDPAGAYSVALAGWQRFARPYWWYAMVESGLKCNRAVDLAELYGDMPQKERTMLSADGRSLYYLALVHRRNGDREASLSAAGSALRHERNNPDLIAGYIWLLVDLNETAALRHMLIESDRLISANPELREPVAAAMMLSGEPNRALSLYRQLASARQEDPAWLISYANVLEQSGHPEAAWQVRHRAQKLVVTRLAFDTGTQAEARQDFLTHVQLMINLSPGDRLTRVVKKIALQSEDAPVRELIMGWATSTGQTDLARFWYWRNYAMTAERPEWAHLGLLLEENDRTAIADLIEEQLERLPFRDAIEGAQRAGMVKTVESQTFERLQANPDDYLLDQRLREFAVAGAGSVSYSLTQENLSGVSWLKNSLTIAGPASGRYVLKAELAERQFDMAEHSRSGKVSAYDKDAGITMIRRHESGYLAASLGVRDSAFNSTATTTLEGQWRLLRDLDLSVRVDYNGRSEETAPLSIGGVRDRLRLLATGAVGGRDALIMELAAMNYRDHHRRYLGTGLSVNMDMRHQIASSWPDYGIRGYSGFTSTRADGVLSADAASLLPANAGHAASTYVPGSFGQIGVGAFAGQSWKSIYTRDLKPFAEVDTGWTTNSGVAFTYGIGMVSPVCGSDQLKVELQQGSGKTGFTGFTSIINLEYRYFY